MHGDCRTLQNGQCCSWGGHHDRHHGHDHSEHDTEHSKRQGTLLADAQEQIVDERQLSLRISFNGS